MGTYIQILAFVVTGIVLLWLGYNLFFGKISPFYPGWFPWKGNKWKKKGDEYRGYAGDPQVCPVCSMKLVKGETVKTIAFPSLSGGMERMIHIRGCYSCLENGLPRRCPVCGTRLSLEDFLVARLFERLNQKNHLHILGCNHCKKLSVIK